MKRIRTSKVLINTILGILSLCWFFPIFFAFFNSVKDRIEYNRSGLWAIPQANNILKNLTYIQQSAGIFTSMINSFFYALGGAVGAVLIAILAAYALAHLPIKRRMFWFLLIYSGTIFPFQMYLIPIFRAYNILNLYNTKQGMVLFYIAICIPFAMFVIRNFFTGISKDVLESAKIDGASNSLILFRILVPMSIAPITVVFFTQFTFCWNDLMFGLTFTKSVPIRPVMAAISMLGQNHIPALLLACIIVSIPTFILFVLLQGKIETGLVYQSK
jgi:multiple sugar transport system permease protein